MRQTGVKPLETPGALDRPAQRGDRFMPRDQNAAPIIIKRKKVVGGGGHHGGAWKVAIAQSLSGAEAFASAALRADRHLPPF